MISNDFFHAYRVFRRNGIGCKYVYIFDLRIHSTKRILVLESRDYEKYKVVSLVLDFKYAFIYICINGRQFFLSNLD